MANHVLNACLDVIPARRGRIHPELEIVASGDRYYGSVGREIIVGIARRSLAHREIRRCLLRCLHRFFSNEIKTPPVVALGLSDNEPCRRDLGDACRNGESGWDLPTSQNDICVVDRALERHQNREADIGQIRAALEQARP